MVKYVLHFKFLNGISWRTEAMALDKGETCLPTDVIGCHLPVLSLDTFSVFFHRSMPKRSTVWYKHVSNLRDAKVAIENAKVRNFDILLLFISSEKWDILSTPSANDSGSIKSRIILLSDADSAAMATRSRPMSMILTPIQQVSTLRVHFHKEGDTMGFHGSSNDDLEAKMSLESSNHVLIPRPIEKTIVPSFLLKSAPVDVAAKIRTAPQAIQCCKDFLDVNKCRKVPIKSIGEVRATMSSNKKGGVEMNMQYGTISSTEHIPIPNQYKTSKVYAGDSFSYSSSAITDCSNWCTKRNKQYLVAENGKLKQYETSMFNRSQYQKKVEDFQIPSHRYSTQMIDIVEKDTLTHVAIDNLPKLGADLRNDNRIDYKLSGNHATCIIESEIPDMLESQLKMTENKKNALNDAKGAISMFTFSKVFRTSISLVFVFGLITFAAKMTTSMFSILDTVNRNQSDLAALSESLEALMVIVRKVKEENNSQHCFCRSSQFNIEQEPETIISYHHNHKDPPPVDTNDSIPTLHINGYHMLTELIFAAIVWLLSCRRIYHMKIPFIACANVVAFGFDYIKSHVLQPVETSENNRHRSIAVTNCDIKKCSSSHDFF